MDMTATELAERLGIEVQAWDSLTPAQRNAYLARQQQEQEWKRQSEEIALRRFQLNHGIR